MKQHYRNHRIFHTFFITLSLLCHYKATWGILQQLWPYPDFSSTLFFSLDFFLPPVYASLKIRLVLPVLELYVNRIILNTILWLAFFSTHICKFVYISVFIQIYFDVVSHYNDVIHFIYTHTTNSEHVHSFKKLVTMSNIAMTFLNVNIGVCKQKYLSGIYV